MYSGPSQGGDVGGFSPNQCLAEQLTLSQPGGADYAHHSTTSPLNFSDLATALCVKGNNFNFNGLSSVKDAYLFYLIILYNFSDQMCRSINEGWTGSIVSYFFSSFGGGPINL